MAEQLDRAIDRRRREATLRRALADDPRLAKIGDEMLDVGGLDVGERPVAEPFQVWSDPPVNRPRQRELLRDGMPLSIDVRDWRNVIGVTSRGARLVASNFADLVEPCHYPSGE